MLLYIFICQKTLKNKCSFLAWLKQLCKLLVFGLSCPSFRFSSVDFVNQLICWCASPQILNLWESVTKCVTSILFMIRAHQGSWQTGIFDLFFNFAKIFNWLWLLLNWQLGEILIGVNTSIMNVLVLKVLQVGLLSLKFWLRACMVCMTPGSQDFFKLNGRISQRNRNRIRKYLGLFIRGLNGFKSWHTPFKVWKLLSLQL